MSGSTGFRMEHRTRSRRIALAAFFIAVCCLGAGMVGPMKTPI
jgi:hypothetical protein